MSEKEFSPESRATPEQVQAVVDEVDRITKDVKVLPGLSNIKYQSAPKKIRWNSGVLFQRYTEGEGNIDDPNSIILSRIGWGNPDGSHTEYGTELTVEYGMQLTKHTYPPSDEHLEARSSVSKEALEDGDYATVALNAATDLAGAKKDHESRVQERTFGLHIATSAEATELIAKLQQMEPAPEQAY